MPDHSAPREDSLANPLPYSAGSGESVDAGSESVDAGSETGSDGSDGSDDEQAGAPETPPATASQETTRQGTDATGRESTAGARSRKGKRGRNRFYVYPTPMSVSVDGDIWSELRRFFVADLLGRQQRHRGRDVSLPASFFCWGEDVASRATQGGSSYREDPLAPLLARRDSIREVFERAGVQIRPEEWCDDGDPSHYRWTQWIFLQMHRRQVLQFSDPQAVRTLQDSSVSDLEDEDSFAPELSEEFRREEDPAGGERSWLLDFGPYCDRLMNDLGKSNWPVVEKKAQRHRIGRLRGCELTLQASHYLRMDYQELKVFTTRVETIYGATFVLIHPWHPILSTVLEPGYEDDVIYYRKRILRGQEPYVSGVRTGGYAINPLNFRRIPILVSRLAMEPELSGAVLGVPAHDPDLFELAHRVRLPVKEVIKGERSRHDVRGKLSEAFCGDGMLTNSGPFSGSATRVARDRIIAKLGKRGGGRRLTRFAIDRVSVSDKGVWGVPVPIVHCPRCGEVPVPESELPVLPPQLTREDLERMANADSTPDLGEFPKFLRAKCPECEGTAERDRHMIQPWLGESWMYLRTHRPELMDEVPGMRATTPQEDATGPEGTTSSDGEPGATAARLLLDNLDENTLFGSDPLTEDTPHLNETDEDDTNEGGVDEDPEADAVPAEENQDPGESDSVGSEASPTEAEEDLSDGEADDSIEANTESEPEAESSGDAAAADASKNGSSTFRPPEQDDDLIREEDLDDDDSEEEGQQQQRVSQRSAFQPFRRSSNRKGLSVDLAIGRHDRGVMDILHTRFLTKFLYDLREVSFYEPFFSFVRSGEVLFKRNSRGKSAEMSPAPDGLGSEALQMMDRYGADAMRLAFLYYRDLTSPLELQEHHLKCMKRFLMRIWRQIRRRLEVGKFVSRRVLVQKHKLIHGVTENLRKMRYHCAVSDFYHFVKFLESPQTAEEEVDRSALQTFLIVLSPFAPYLASELWSLSGGQGRVEEQEWPEASAELLQPHETDIPVFINKRLRCLVQVTSGHEKDQLQELVLQDEVVAQAIAGRPTDKIYTVPDRVVSILLKEDVPSQDESGDQ